MMSKIRTLTRKGIALDLQLSPYSWTISYSKNEKSCYIFSSSFNVERFRSRLYENRQRINESLSNRFKMPVVLNRLADAFLYRSIEHRGFLIIENGREVTWQKVELSGENLMKLES